MILLSCDTTNVSAKFSTLLARSVRHFKDKVCWKMTIFSALPHCGGCNLPQLASSELSLQSGTLSQTQESCIQRPSSSHFDVQLSEKAGSYRSSLNEGEIR